MTKYLFFAKFIPDLEVGGFSVEFPELEGAYTEGDDLYKALENAEECLGLHLYGLEEDGDIIPSTPDISNIELKVGEFLIPITIYMDMVRNEMNEKSVKKTLTIPKWLNDECETLGINFSKVLQDALKFKLGTKRL